MVGPEPAEAGEVPRRRGHPRGALDQREEGAVLELQGAEAARRGRDRVGVAVGEDPLEEGPGVELDRVVVVAPGRAGGLRERVAADLVGEVAVANCRMAYVAFEELFGGARFAPLRAAGAWPQRVLWASTSAKDPAYSPVKYVESLVAADTVNTLPLATIDAYRDMGRPAEAMAGVAFQGEIVIDQLRLLGIEIEDVAHQLETEAIDKFVQPFEKLLAAIDTKRESIYA